jgi:hypothetical protein
MRICAAQRRSRRWRDRPVDLVRDTPWPRHTPWDGSQPLFRIGLAPLDLRDWIEPDEKLASYLAEKERLLAARRGDVFAAETGTEDAQREAWSLLTAHLVAVFPQVWQAGPEGVFVQPAGRAVGIDVQAPLISAARLVQEDLVLMRKGAEGWRVAAGCVCFPSSWQLTDKFGKPIARVHAPVPNFGPGSRNAGMIERIFDNLQPSQPVWRLNWSLYPDDRLFHGDVSTTVRRSPELSETFLRVEYQTLRKLEHSGDILFTIRISLDPASLIARHPERARLAAGLRDLIARLTPEELEYKGMTAIRDRLFQQLGALATGGCS